MTTLLIAALVAVIDEYERERNQWRADCQQQLIYTTEALQRAETAEAQLAEARRALGFFASVIMSGEPWTEVCEQRYRAALAPAEDGPDTDYDPSRDM